MRSTTSRQFEAPATSSDVSAYGALPIPEPCLVLAGSMGRTLNVAKVFFPVPGDAREEIDNNRDGFLMLFRPLHVCGCGGKVDVIRLFEGASEEGASMGCGSKLFRTQ